MDDKEERENRCNLVSVCMKELFEQKVFEKLISGPNLEEMDAWLDPEIKKYFTELDAVQRYYNPEDFVDLGTLLLDEEHIKHEKCGIINYSIQTELKKQATEVLSNAKSIEEADETLKKLLSDTKREGEFVCRWYGIDPNAEE